MLKYIATQLKLFRAAGRVDDIDSDEQKRVNDAAKEGEMGMMQTVASKLSDCDIRVLSDYIMLYTNSLVSLTLCCANF